MNKTFISAALKGISQVILIENAISGLLILLAITVSSLKAGFIALLSAFIGTFVGKICGMNEETVNRGVLGYNSVLTGMALMLFLTGTSRWVFALGGAVIAAFLTAAFLQIMKNSGMPVLTFPFILLTWLVLLSSYKLTTIQLSPKLAPQNLSHIELKISGTVNPMEGIVNGVGQIFFLHHLIAGILLFIAIFWAGWKLGLYAILGNAAALLVAYVLGAEHSLMILGLYEYNAILTIIAVSVVFNENNNRKTAVLGLFAACLTVPLTASVDALLLPYGLPALTMPFVLSTWIFIGAGKVMFTANTKE